MSDHHLVYYSWAAYFNDMMRTGVFPLWNSLSFSGGPFGADMQSNLTFLNLAAFLFNDVNAAWNVVMLLNVLFAAVFTYFYMIKIGVHAFGAVISSIIFAFVPSSGAYSDSWAFFIPLMLWLTESYFISNRLRYLLCAVLAFSILILNALPQYSLYAGLLVGFYIFVRRKSLLGVVILIVSLGLVSFYVFRLFELLTLSQRQVLHFVNVLLPTHLINVIFPYFFESPFLGKYNFFLPKIFQELTRIIFQTTSVQYIAPPYVGVLGFTFFLFSWKEKGPVKFYLSTVAIILFYEMTFPVFSGLYRKVPILAQLPRLERLSAVVTFALAVLSGIGASKVIRKGAGIKGVALFYGLLSAVIVTGMLTIRILVTTQKNVLRKLFVNYIESNMLESGRYSAPLEFYLKRIDDFFLFINKWTDVLSPSIFVPITLMALSVLIIYLWQRSKITKRIFFISGLLILCIDVLFIFRLSHYGISAPGQLKQSSAVIDFLKKDNDIFRVMPILEPVDFGGARTRILLSPNSNLLYGLSSVEGYAPLFPERYSTFFKGLQKHYDGDPALIMGGAEGDFDYEVMRFLNVKYFLTRKDVSLKNDLPVVVQDDEYRLYLNRGYYPRAFLVYDYRVLFEQSEILSYMKREGFMFDRTVVLEESPSPGFDIELAAEGPRHEEVSIESIQPHELALTVNSSRNAFLVLTENYYPGWRAEVNGRPAKIYRANYSFRALEIPKGRHEIHFYYEPKSYQYGLMASGASLLFGAVLMMIAVRRKNRRFSA